MWKKNHFSVNLPEIAKNLSSKKTDNKKNLTKNQLFIRYCLNCTGYFTHFTRIASPENRFN